MLYGPDHRTHPSPRVRAERLSDAVVHVLGLSLAAIAVPVLVWMAVTWRGDAGTVAAVSVYCATLLAMLGCSALYNMSAEGRFTPLFKRLDHSAIYLKIAGSFTPLVALTGSAGVGFLAGLWAVALGGTSLKMIAPDRLRWLGLALYLGLAWVGVYFGREILADVDRPVAILIAVAGVLYTLGVPIFLAKRLPFQTAIWHAIVLIATGILFTAVCLEVTRDLSGLTLL